jgi:hypothetical protein
VGRVKETHKHQLNKTQTLPKKPTGSHEEEDVYKRYRQCATRRTKGDDGRTQKNKHHRNTEEGKMDALHDRIRDANIHYIERSHYKEKLLRRLDGLPDLNKEDGNMLDPIWQGTDGLWHVVEALKLRPLTDQGRQRLHKLDGLLKTGGNKATQGLELLIFSGNRDTKEHASTIHSDKRSNLKHYRNERDQNL